MKKFLKTKINLILAVILVVISIVGTFSITYTIMNKSRIESIKPNNEISLKSINELYSAAVKDAMTIEEDEILPLVNLEKGEPYATYNNDGSILLLTFHKYPKSYPNGENVKIKWGEVWTFTGGELANWYKDNKETVNDWPIRLKQLIGLPPDNKNTTFTAMWVKPKNIVRPANIQDIGKVTMINTLSKNANETFIKWFNNNIIWSYFDSAYPWTRLGYTYDWGENSKSEYGLSEFLVLANSEVEVAYTVTIDEMLSMLEDGSWLPKNKN